MTVAGQVIFNRDNLIQHKLIDVQRPILSIPSLAIHLDRSVSDGFQFNKESHLLPILASIGPKSTCDKITEKIDEENINCSITNEHHEDFLKLIAKEAGCIVEEILDIDLYLYDTQKAVKFFDFGFLKIFNGIIHIYFKKMIF